MGGHLWPSRLVLHSGQSLVLLKSGQRARFVLASPPPLYSANEVPSASATEVINKICLYLPKYFTEFFFVKVREQWCPAELWSILLNT